MRHYETLEVGQTSLNGLSLSTTSHRRRKSRFIWDRSSWVPFKASHFIFNQTRVVPLSDTQMVHIFFATLYKLIFIIVREGCWHTNLRYKSWKYKIWENLHLSLTHFAIDGDWPIDRPFFSLSLTTLFFISHAAFKETLKYSSINLYISWTNFCVNLMFFSFFYARHPSRPPHLA